MRCFEWANIAARLRMIKQRDSKPFAVMFRDMEQLGLICSSQSVEDCLLSWRRPIIAATKEKAGNDINRDMQTLGCMLPYMPLRVGWFEALDTPGFGDDQWKLERLPGAITPARAEEQLSVKSLLYHHSRDIRNRSGRLGFTSLRRSALSDPSFAGAMCRNLSLQIYPVEGILWLLVRRK